MSPLNKLFGSNLAKEVTYFKVKERFFVSFMLGFNLFYSLKVNRNKRFGKVLTQFVTQWVKYYFSRFMEFNEFRNKIAKIFSRFKTTEIMILGICMIKVVDPKISDAAQKVLAT